MYALGTPDSNACCSLSFAGLPVQRNAASQASESMVGAVSDLLLASNHRSSRFVAGDESANEERPVPLPFERKRRSQLSTCSLVPSPHSCNRKRVITNPTVRAFGTCS